MYYKLVNKEIVPCSLLEFKGTKIKVETINNIVVSTVFLGIDHRVDFSEGKPILFETMVFGGELDEDMDRYCTYDEAIKGHDEFVEKVKNLVKTKEEEE